MKKITVIFEDTDQGIVDTRINRFFISECDSKREPTQFSKDFEIVYQHLIHLARCLFRDTKMKYREENNNENT